MRPRLPLLRSAAAGLVAAVLLTGCGGSGDDEPAAGSSATSSSAATSSPETSAGAPQADSEFCTEARALIGELNTAFVGATDPAATAQGLRDAVAQLRALEPPAEIQADWTALADGVEEFATVMGEVDPNDPGSLTRLEQTSRDLQARLLPAATSVQAHLSQQCGLQAPTTAASPS